MKKKITVLMGVLVISVSMLFTGCRSVSVSGKGEKETEETKKKNKATEKDTEDETTKKNKPTERDTEEETEEETTQKSSEHDDWSEYYGTGYSISLSSDWIEKSDVEGTELGFAHFGTSADGFTENINALTQDTSSFDMDLDDYKDISLQQYKQLGYDVIDISSKTVNGKKGYYLTTTVEQSGTTCYLAQWFTLVDDTAYVFTFAGDEDGFDELENEVIEIFETIEIY